MIFLSTFQYLYLLEHNGIPQVRMKQATSLPGPVEILLRILSGKLQHCVHRFSSLPACTYPTSYHSHWNVLHQMVRCFDKWVN